MQSCDWLLCRRLTASKQHYVIKALAGMRSWCCCQKQREAAKWRAVPVLPCRSAGRHHGCSTRHTTPLTCVKHCKQRLEGSVAPGVGQALQTAVEEKRHHLHSTEHGKSRG